MKRLGRFLISFSSFLFCRRLAGSGVLTILSSVFHCVISSSRSAGTTSVSLHARPLEVCPLLLTAEPRSSATHDSAVRRVHQGTLCRGVSTPHYLKSFLTVVDAQGDERSKNVQLSLQTLCKQKMCMREGSSHDCYDRGVAELRCSSSFTKAHEEGWRGGRVFPCARSSQVHECCSACFLSIRLPSRSASRRLFLRLAGIRDKVEKAAYSQNRSLDHTRTFEDRPSPPTVVHHARNKNYPRGHARFVFLYASSLFNDNRELYTKGPCTSKAFSSGPSPRSSASCFSRLYDGPRRKHSPEYPLELFTSGRRVSTCSRTKCLSQCTPPSSAAGHLMMYPCTNEWASQNNTQHRAEHKRAGWGEASVAARDESQPVYSEIDDEVDLPPAAAASKNAHAASAQAARPGRAAAGTNLDGSVRLAGHRETAYMAGRCTAARGVAPSVTGCGTVERRGSHMAPFCNVADSSSENEEAKQKDPSKHETPSPFHNHVLFDEKVFEKMNVLRQLIFTFESSANANIDSASIDTKYLPLLCEGDLLERTLQLARENYEKQVALQASGDAQEKADIFAAAAEWRQQMQRSALPAAATAAQQQQQQYESGAEGVVASPLEAPAASKPRSSSSPTSPFRSEGLSEITRYADPQQETDGFLQAHAAAKKEAAITAKMQGEYLEREEGCVRSSRGRGVFQDRNSGNSSSIRSTSRQQDFSGSGSGSSSNGRNGYFELSNSSRGSAGAGADADVLGQPVLPRTRSAAQQLRRFEEVAAQLLLLANFYRRRLARKKVGDPQQIDATFFTMAEQRQLDAHLLNFIEELIREAHIKYTTYKQKEALSETALKLLKRRIEAHLELEKHKRQDFVRILSLCFQSRTEKRRAVLKATLYTLEDLYRFQEWLEEGILYGEETGKLNNEQLQIMRALVKDCKRASPVENRFLDRWGEENEFQSDINLQYTWDNIMQGDSDSLSA